MQLCSPLDADDRNKMPDDRQKKRNVLYKSGIHGQADLRTLCHHSTEYTHPGNQVYTRYGSYPSSRLCSQENTPRTHRTKAAGRITTRSEEHTSELQSRVHLVCRLLFENKSKQDEI